VDWVGAAPRAALTASGRRDCVASVRQSTRVLTASGRVGTACRRWRIAVSVWRIGNGSGSGRGKAPPCTPMQTRSRRSHAPTFPPYSVLCTLFRYQPFHLCTARRLIWTFAPSPFTFPPLLSVLHTLYSVLCTLVPLFHLCRGLRPICTFALPLPRLCLDSTSTLPRLSPRLPTHSPFSPPPWISS
jgi:hypothetical protein